MERVPGILVIDDEDPLRQLLRRMLTGLGYQVFEAPDGESGLELFRAHAGEIDAVVLDLMMPGLGGCAVLERLHALRSDLPVLLSSGYSDHGSLNEMLSRDGVYFLQKPFRRAELADRIAEALGGGAV